MSGQIAYQLAQDEQYLGRDLEKAMTREAWSATLLTMAESHPEIVVLSADLMKATLASRFSDKFPDRSFNVGVAEQDLVGVAAGLALAGKIPVVATFAVFLLMRACEQVRTDVCYPKLNVKLIGTAGGFSFGLGGVTHATTEDLSIARALPNMTVLAPADFAETSEAMRAAIEQPGPVYLRVGRSAEPVIYRSGCSFQIGRANILRRGEDVSLLACGSMVFEALEAAEILAKQRIATRVVDMHSIKPLDASAVVSAATESRALLTIEEHTVVGALGSAVAETLAEAGVAVPFKRLGMNDAFATEGNADYLRQLYGLQAEVIAREAEALLGSTRPHER
jgi:transketolase